MYLLTTTEHILVTDVLNRDLHEQRINRAMGISLRELQKDVKDAMVYGTHTGRLYPQSMGNGFTRAHQASAPGESPAPRTFALVNSVQSEQYGAYAGEVRVEQRYGSILEKKMNRPVLAKVSNKYRQKFINNIAEATKIRKLNYGE